MQVNWQKFALLLTALIGLFALVIAGQAMWSDISGPVGLIVGYGTANGIGAKRGQSTSGVFEPANPRRRATDLGEPEP